MDTISIIVPVYNAEKTIRRCIESLCTQDNKWRGEYINIQVVAVNDGSTDSTKEILDALQERYSNLVVLHKVNGGAAAARKYGIDHSDSDYLGFCDADDYVDPDMYITLYVYLKKYNADFTMCGAYLGMDQEVVIQEEPYKIWEWSQDEAYRRFLEHIHLNGVFWTNLFKRGLFKDLDWNFDIKYFEDDFIIWQVIGKVHKVIKVLTPKYHYIDVSSSLTHASYGYNQYYSTKIVSEKIIRDCSNPEFLQYYGLAESLRYRWIVKDFHSYISSQWKNKEAEQYMLKILRQGWARQIRKLPSSKMKIIATALAISPSITQQLLRLYRNEQ